MEKGRLRRERLSIFFARIIKAKAPLAKQPALAEYFETLANKESLGRPFHRLRALDRSSGLERDQARLQYVQASFFGLRIVTNGEIPPGFALS
jgi:hypothetical protein